MLFRSCDLVQKLNSSLSLTAPYSLQSSNPYIFFISSPNHIKQSVKFLFFNPLQNPPIKIFINFMKWQNHQRSARAHLPPPPLQATTTTVLPVTLRHHQTHIFRHHALSLYFPPMTNVKGITPPFPIVSFLTLNSLILNSLREKTLIVIKFFKNLN